MINIVLQILQALILLVNIDVKSDFFKYNIIGLQNVLVTCIIYKDRGRALFLVSIEKRERCEAINCFSICGGGNPHTCDAFRKKNR